MNTFPKDDSVLWITRAELPADAPSSLRGGVLWVGEKKDGSSLAMHLEIDGEPTDADMEWLQGYAPTVINALLTLVDVAKRQRQVTPEITETRDA